MVSTAVRRKMLEWEVHGDRLVGTLHVPPRGERGELALLVLNSGPAPRAGNSDLSVHVAERVASRGVPVARFDLPGLGDSSGAMPADAYAFWRDVLDGRNDAATVALVRRMRSELGCARVVVGGLCAAVVPALRAAEVDAEGGEDAIGGLLLLEPNFRLAAQTGDAAPRRTKLEKALSGRDWMRFLQGESAIARAVRPLAPLLSSARAAELALPRDAHVPLVMRWRAALERGIPSLAVVAEGLEADRYATRILEGTPSEAARHATLVRVPNTNHLFRTGDARGVVLDAVEAWTTTIAGAGARSATSPASPTTRRTS